MLLLCEIDDRTVLQRIIRQSQPLALRCCRPCNYIRLCCRCDRRHLVQASGIGGKKSRKSSVDAVLKQKLCPPHGAQPDIRILSLRAPESICTSLSTQRIVAAHIIRTARYTTLLATLSSCHNTYLRTALVCGSWPLVFVSQLRAICRASMPAGDVQSRRGCALRRSPEDQESSGSC